MRPQFVPLVLAILVGFTGSSDGFFGGGHGPGHGWGDYSNCGYAQSLWTGFCAQGQGCGTACCGPTYAYGFDGWGPGCNYGTGLAGCFTRKQGCGAGACGGCGTGGCGPAGFGGPGFGPAAAFSLAPQTRAVGYGGTWFGGFGGPCCGPGQCGAGGGCGGGCGGLLSGLKNRIGRQSWVGGGPLDSYGLVGGFPNSDVGCGCAATAPVGSTWDGAMVNDSMMGAPGVETPHHAHPHAHDGAHDGAHHPAHHGNSAEMYDGTSTLRDSEFDAGSAFSGESQPVTDDVEVE